MTPVQLPEVPEPFMELRHYLSPAVYDAWADQLRAYATEAVMAERRESNMRLREAVATLEVEAIKAADDDDRDKFSSGIYRALCEIVRLERKTTTQPEQNSGR